MKKKQSVNVKSRKIIGRDPTSQLYRAVIRFVESRSGSIVVIGGITTIELPGDREFIFHVAVKCCGRKPKPVEPTP
jgi:hypothetical protein